MGAQTTINITVNNNMENLMIEISEKNNEYCLEKLRKKLGIRKISLSLHGKGKRIKN